MPQPSDSSPLLPPLPAGEPHRKVLITGAAGNIGSFLADYAAHRYDLRLMVRESDQGVEKLHALGEVVTCDLSDLAGLKRISAGIDTVVHLAAVAGAWSTWDQLLPANIIGTYNAFAAARAAGCRRVIFASSIHAVSGNAPDVQVKTSEPVNPGDLYGVTKCFGEALARYMATQEGLSAICLRIGAYQSPEQARETKHLSMMDSFISKRDLAQLVCRCIESPNLSFAIFNAVSDNRFKRLDISDARAMVGYAPQDDFMRENPLLRDAQLHRHVAHHSLHDPGAKSGLRDDIQD